MRRSLLAGLVLAGAACAGRDSTSPSVPVATYSLKTVNGSALPFRLPTNDGSLYQLVADSLTLNANGTYRELSYYSIVLGHNVQSSMASDAGKYSNNDGGITFQDRTDDMVYHGSVAGGILTQSVGGYTQVFQRN